MQPGPRMRDPAPAVKLLVTTSRSLLLVDTASGQYRPIHRGAGLYYGLAATPRHTLAAARGRMVSSATDPAHERGEILVFDRRLGLVDTWQAPFPLRDIHEIKWHRGHLWVTCSYDNMVAIRSPAGQWQAWYPLGEPESPPRDRNHFNSLALEGDALWLLAHNRGASEILHFRLPDRTLLGRYLLGQQAHNLWRHGRGWATCSSAEGRIVAQDGLGVDTGAFPRGIAPLPDGWAVGLSQLAERDQRDYCDGQLALYDRRWRRVHAITLPGEGLVLDLLPCHQGWRRWWQTLSTAWSARR